MAPKRKASTAAAASASSDEVDTKTNDKKIKPTAKDGSEAAASGATATGGSQRSVWWDDSKQLLNCIDQRNLPNHFAVAQLKTVGEVESAIKTMLVRGAPAIGAAGGFGMAIAALQSTATTTDALIADLVKAQKLLDASRPTAVNLSWATARLMQLVRTIAEHKKPVAFIRDAVLVEAKQLADDDVAINQRLAGYGAALVKPNANILHHCNTGRLATVDYGTALGVIYTCHEQGKNVHVWVDETRPRLQGARLTAWELMRAGVDLHLVVDSCSGLLMSQGKIDICFVGADRAVRNGDVANKIGTYNAAVVAREHGVPFYVCVPTSTIDLTIETGKSIVIEERSRDEVVKIDGASVAPENCPVFNPAFDVTPAKYISGIITEEGICYPPYEISLAKAKKAAEERIQNEWKVRIAAHLGGSSGGSAAAAAKKK